MAGRTTRDTRLERPVALKVLPADKVADGRWLLYEQLDRSESDIMLIENFH